MLRKLLSVSPAPAARGEGPVTPGGTTGEQARPDHYSSGSRRPARSPLRVLTGGRMASWVWDWGGPQADSRKQAGLWVHICAAGGGHPAAARCRLVSGSSRQPPSFVLVDFLQRGFNL